MLTAQVLVSRLIATLLKTACAVAVGGSALYVATLAYGMATGAALPAATIFHIFPRATKLLEFEPRLSTILLGIAFTGAVVSWLGRIGILSTDLIEASDLWIERALRRSALILIFVCLTATINAGGWGGKVFVPSLSWASMLNLLPLSDAAAYAQSSWNRAINDQWDMVSANRPLAQAMRDLTFLLSRYSYSGSLLLQASLLSLTTALAAGRISRYQGVWSAIAFVGFVTAITRTLLPSMMTEPLALAFALFGFAFLLDLLRKQDGRNAAVVALSAITVALNVRMGSMFVIPFLVVWAAYTMRRDYPSRLRLGALLGFACLAVFSVAALIGRLYAPAGGAPGGNFAMTLCGLAVGGSWGDCYLKLYANDVAGLDPHSRAVAAIMLKGAASHILEAPNTFLLSLARNVASYLRELPQYLIPDFKTAGLSLQVLLLAVLAARLLLYLRQAGGRESTFWFGLFLSVCASAAFVYADGSQRVMEVGSAMLAILISFSLTTKSATARTAPLAGWKTGIAAVGVLLVLATAAPAALHAVTQRWVWPGPRPLTTEHEVILAGGRMLTGFVVVDDRAQLPEQAAAFALSDFKRAADWLGMKRDYGLDIDSLEVPFALVAGMQFGGREGYLFVTPPEVLTKRNVAAWRLAPRGDPTMKPIQVMNAAPFIID